MASAEPRTLLLFCPFDKKVTRHARRGPRMQMYCIECGRGLDPEPEDRSGKGVEAASKAAVPSTRPAPEAPDLAEVLAASRAPGRPDGHRARPAAGRRSMLGSAASVAGESAAAPSPAKPTSSGRRRVRPRSAGAGRVHPALLVAAAFFSALAVFNVLGNLFAGGPSAPEAAPSPDAAVYLGQVTNTDGQGVFLRRSPNPDDRLPNAVPEGLTVRVIGEDSWVNGTPWRQVETTEGLRGWVPAQYIVLLPAG